MALTASGSVVSVGCVLLIHNPTAGRHRRKLVEDLKTRLRAADVRVTTLETAAFGDAERFARAAVDSLPRPDLVIAAGGDGTVNEIANGLLGSDLPLAVMPLGTVNVLARELGLAGPVDRIAATILAGRAGLVWPGLANGRAFLLMVGVGFDATVVAAVSPSLKRRFGRAAYLIAAARLWWRWQPGIRVLDANGVTYRVASVLIARCRLYAGSYVSANAARLDEPHLNLVLFERDGRLWALSYVFALAIGRLHIWPGVRHLKVARARIERPHLVQIDGDPCDVPSLDVSVAATPLRMICAASRIDGAGSAGSRGSRRRR